MENELILTKVAIASNTEFINKLIDKLDIKKTDKVAVAFWVSPIVYREVCKRSNDVCYIEDVSSKGIFGNIEKAKFIDLNKGEYWPNMKFDKVIMNPPYDDLGNTIAEDIMKIVFEHLSDNGKTVCLNKANFFKSPYLKVDIKKDGGRFNKFKFLLKHISNIDIIPRDEFNKLFSIGGASDGAIIEMDHKEHAFFSTFNNNKLFELVPQEEESLLYKVDRKNITKYWVALRRQTYSKDDTTFIYTDKKYKDQDQRNFLTCYFKTAKEREDFITIYESEFIRNFISVLKSGKTTPLVMIPYIKTLYEFEVIKNKYETN